MNPHLADKTVQEFIKTHTPSEVKNLVFQPPLFDGVSNAELVYQIEALSKLQKKNKAWSQTSGIILAPAKAIEQSSSALTAWYKAEVIKSLIQDQCQTAVDLTSGLGVDTHAFSKQFKRVEAIESDLELATLSAHNFNQLNAGNIKVTHTTAERFIEEQDLVDFIFLDPDRRDQSGMRRIGFEHYAPNILTLYPALIKKARVVAIKVSPMIDLHYAEKLLPDLFRIELLSVGNELKELVLWLSTAFDTTEKKLVHAFLYKDRAPQIFEEPWTTTKTKAPQPLLGFEDAAYLFDPAAAFLKSKRLDTLLHEYDSLHEACSECTLLTTSKEIHGLPGRLFKIEECLPYSKNQLNAFKKQAFSVQVHQRRQRADELKKTLGLKESETDFLFIIGQSPGLIIRATKVII